MKEIRSEASRTISFPIETIGFAAHLFDLPLDLHRVQRRRRFNKIRRLLMAAELIVGETQILYISRGLNERGEIVIVVTISLSRKKKVKK